MLSKLLSLHITRNQTEHLLGMLFQIGLEPFHLLSSCVKASLNIKQKLTTESYILWISLNTGDEEEFSCQIFFSTFRYIFKSQDGKTGKLKYHNIHIFSRNLY